MRLLRDVPTLDLTELASNNYIMKESNHVTYTQLKSHSIPMQNTLLARLEWMDIKTFVTQDDEHYSIAIMHDADDRFV